MNDNYKTINAAEQLQREDSVFHFYKKLIALREQERFSDTIVYGRTEPVLLEENNIMAYFRRGKGQDILVIGNFDRVCRTVKVGQTEGEILLNNCKDVQINGDSITLDSCQALVIAYLSK